MHFPQTQLSSFVSAPPPPQGPYFVQPQNTSVQHYFKLKEHLERRLGVPSMIRTFATATTLYVQTYFGGVIIFLHQQCFVTVELYSHILDFKMYGIVYQEFIQQPIR